MASLTGKFDLATIDDISGKASARGSIQSQRAPTSNQFRGCHNRAVLSPFKHSTSVRPALSPVTAPRQISILVGLALKLTYPNVRHAYHLQPHQQS